MNSLLDYKTSYKKLEMCYSIKYREIFIILIFTFFQFYLFANEIITLKSRKEIYYKEISQYIELIPDSCFKSVINPAIENIINDNTIFKPYKKNKIRNETNNWFKFRIKNESEEPLSLVLKVGKFNYLTLFQKTTNGKIITHNAGTFLPSNKQSVTFTYLPTTLKLNPIGVSEIHDFYLKVKNDFRNTSDDILTIHLTDYEKLKSEVSASKAKLNWHFGLFIGMLSIIALYNCLTYINFRQKEYLYYAIYVGSISFTIYLNVFGKGLTNFVDYQIIKTISILISINFYFLFLQKTLDLPNLSKKINSILKIFLPILNFLLISEIFLFICLKDFKWLASNSFIIALNNIVFAISIFFIHKKANKTQKYFTVGAFIFYVNFVIGLSLHLIFSLKISNLIIESGIILEILIFSLGLGKRMNEIEKLKTKAEKDYNNVLKNQNNILEKKVFERTRELQIANNNLSLQQKELQVANEELSQHQEELIMLNENLQNTYDDLQKTSDRLNSNIKYAQQIQAITIPEENLLLEYFSDVFSIYLPKDDVSGDFYWFHRINDTKSIFVLADCTGHGVSGAFMSMIGNTLLHETIIKNNIYSPAKILENLGKSIRSVLKQYEKKNSDGMDISICLFEKNRNEINCTFSSAKSYILINQGNGELLILKGDKIYIGGYHLDQNDLQFTEQEIKLFSGNIVYLLSDGFADQNNSERRKFGSRNLSRILSDISNYCLSEQKEKLLDALKEHQGNELQRDDISIVGLQI